MFESVKKIGGSFTVTVKKAEYKTELIDRLPLKNHSTEDFLGFSEVIRKITNSVSSGGSGRLLANWKSKIFISHLTLSIQGKLVVGHNMLLDLCHILGINNRMYIYNIIH
jgi:hypothetical protein